MPLVTAPQAAGLPTTPYLTVAEFRAAPTDVDLTALAAQGDQQQQDDALAQIISQASSAMDAYVHYPLGATLDTDTKRVRVRNDGYVRVPVRGIPVLEVDSFSIGLVPSQMAPITSAPDAWIEDNVICMPAILGTSTAPSRSFGIFSYGSWVYCTFTYVNGYANTTLAASATQGASSLSLNSALGVYPGTNLVIYDSGRTETVVVAPTYVSTTGAGPTTVALAAPLVNAHVQVGVSVSALPPNVKKAAILVTTAFIKVRGAAGLVLDTIDAHAVKEATDEGGAIADIALAESLLARFILPTYF